MVGRYSVKSARSGGTALIGLRLSPSTASAVCRGSLPWYAKLRPGAAWMLPLSITSTSEKAFHRWNAFVAPSCRRTWLTALYGDRLSSVTPSATAAVTAATPSMPGASHAGRLSSRPAIAAAPARAMTPATTTAPAAPTMSGKTTDSKQPIPAPTRLAP